MLTYELKKMPGVPLYEALYRCIRSDILSGALKRDERLPSKRALAANLEVSKITVETAYNQLLSEGYIRAEERRGYFVEEVRYSQAPQRSGRIGVQPEEQLDAVDLTANGSASFPFSVWSRLQRQVLLDYGEKLLLPMPNRGAPELRQAIADHLAGFRGMVVDPENILVGAGTDFLYNLLIQLLGRDKVYAVEEPGYDKIRRIYDAGGVACVSASMDSQGVVPGSLGDAGVLHISPSHHFPTGLVTSVSRRQELLEWAGEDRFIIEDDYDSEFRFDARPKPAMFSLDRRGRVIYMNTFSKTLAPSIRISYMVLPEGLMGEFQRRLGFYGCTVPSFEQMTLAAFLSKGYFEKHINRMRRFYRARRNQVITLLKNCPYRDRLTILEQDAGLHFIVRVATPLDDDALTVLCREKGIRVRSLCSYYNGSVPPEDLHCLVVNYSGLDDSDIEKLAKILDTV